MRAMTALLPIAICLQLALQQSALHAQSNPAPHTIQLQPATARLAEEFTSLDHLRELADGRVLVVDGHENRLVVADLARGTVLPLSHLGSGPGEYRSIDALYPLAGDSTLLVDGRNGRWLLLSGARVVSTIPPDAPAVAAARGDEVGADYAGHLLAQLHAGRITGDPLRRLDSPYVAVVNRRTGKADTIGRIRPKLSYLFASTTTPDGRLSAATYRSAPFSANEQVAIFPDGWIAIARLDPYRVDWRPPTGQWLHGAPIPLPMVKVDDAEKRAWMTRIYRAAPAPPDLGTVSHWPETIPPFEWSDSSVVLATPDGALLIRRTPSARHPENLYDLIDRHGVRTAQLSLPVNEHVIGFGAHSIYIVVIDADDVQRLQRHPWP